MHRLGTEVILALSSFLVVAIGLIAAGRRLHRWSLAVAAAPFLLGTVVCVEALRSSLDGRPWVSEFRWIPQLGVILRFRADTLGATMGLVICGVGVLVVAYSGGYFASATERFHHLGGLLALFGGAMLGVVLSDDLFGLFVFWEITSISSYLLIGFRDEDSATRGAALQALLVTGGGGLALLAGSVLLAAAAGTSQISALAATIPGGGLATVGLALALVGAMTKSAQVPFSFWLPGAMVAPTPISAYLHSATMVKAGVILVARLAPAGLTTTWWQPVVCAVGGVTMVVGGARALRQVDLKLILAHSTVSQLGVMVMLFGAGRPELSGAGLAVLVAHALYKSTLFMSVGMIDHQHHTRNLRELPESTPAWRPTMALILVAAASMAGLPPTFGFAAKESMLAATSADDFALRAIVTLTVVVGSVLGVIAAVRLVWGALGRGRIAAGDPASLHDRAPLETDVAAPPPWTNLAPAVLPASLSLALVGVLPWMSRLVASSATMLWGNATNEPIVGELHLYDGLTRALVLSVVIIAGGIVGFALLGRSTTGPQRSVLPSGARVFTWSIRQLNVVAARTTGLLQNGSLPIYIGVILLFVCGLPLVVGLVGATGRDSLPSFADHPLELVIIPVIISAAISAGVVRRRFAAAICLGAVGYGMIAAFLLFGAPDLALTQAVVETLTTVIFVLVLRALPDEFQRPAQRASRLTQGFRVVVSLVVTVFVFLAVIVSVGDRTATPISQSYLEDSLPAAGGRNVVNVILVDFRGFDTLGEITVLAIAALGAVSLARFTRSERLTIRRPIVAPPHRSLLLDIVLRVAFPSLLVLSLYFLFAGHNQPGGGFVGGLVAGIGFGIRYAAGGIDELKRSARVSPWLVLGAGLMVAGFAGIVPVLAGGDILQSAKVGLDLGPLGSPKFSTATFFDGGVYLVVVGLILMVFEAFGLPTTDDAPDQLATTNGIDVVDDAPEPAR